MIIFIINLSYICFMDANEHNPFGPGNTMKTVFLCMLVVCLTACKPEGYVKPNAAQAIAEPLITEALAKSIPGYEADGTRLSDSVMVDMETFVQLQDWDEKKPVTHVLYRNSMGLLDRLSNLPVMEENLCASDRDPRGKTIVAYYVYHHQYYYTDRGRRCLGGDIFMYSPLTQKVYQHDPFPTQRVRMN